MVLVLCAYHIHCYAIIHIVPLTWMVCSPYELTFGHKMTRNPNLEVQPDIFVSGTFPTYYENPKKNLQYLCSRLQRFRSQRTDLLNRNKKYHAYQAGQIVYMYHAKGNNVHAGSKKSHAIMSGH